jgi:hypothetical protein
VYGGSDNGAIYITVEYGNNFKQHAALILVVILSKVKTEQGDRVENTLQLSVLL